MTKKDSQVKFLVVRIYLRDLSIESPAVPQVFNSVITPQLSVDASVDVKILESNLFEVILKIIVTISSGNKTILLVELFQAGMFHVEGYSKEVTDNMLQVICPGILFPYAREAVDNIVVKASFPATMIQPLNFEALFRSRK